MPVPRQRFSHWMPQRVAADTLVLALVLLLGTAGVGCTEGEAGSTEERPNVVLIYADDIGYGDLGSYGATRVSTPYLDTLAQQGVRFTDAYASSSTCTPSRYSLLTGRYAFRKEGASVLPGDAPMLIDTSRTTLATLLQEAGYATGIVGKWHLGLGTGAVD